MKPLTATLKKSSALAFVRKSFAAVLLCLLFSFISVSAATFGEYRENVAGAAKLTRNLLQYVGKNYENGTRDDAFESETLAEIRRLLPPNEKIEWEGATVETENKWIADKLKIFEERRDPAEREKILMEIDERLSAIESRMAELDRSAAANRTKDEDKRKLGEILRRQEFQKPDEKQESWFEKLQRRIREWFNEKFPTPDIPEGAGDRVQSLSVFLQIILYVVILGLIGFLIYRFAPFFAEKFRRSAKEETDERVILGERVAAHENSDSLFGEAEALARAGDLRGAIRKGYIALLCELSDRKIIGLAQHKTNRDYLRDVRRRRALYQKMHGLTDNFERHWYGFETADEEDWNEFKRDYQKAVGESSLSL